MEVPLTAEDLPTLLQCLAGALNQNPEVQKQSEAYIASLETRPGFCVALADIVGNEGMEHSARWLASVHFKNFVNKHWKKKQGQKCVAAEERAAIKAKLLHMMPNQADNQIAVQVALVYAKIARFDFPSEWPNLFQDLMDVLKSGQASVLVVRRVYLVLHHVLKELSSKRLPADKRTFAEVANFLFGHVWDQWCADTQLLLEGLPSGLASPTAAGQPALICFERWLLLLKIVRRLILFGFESDARSLRPVQAVNACMPPIVHTLQKMTAFMCGASLDWGTSGAVDLAACKRPPRSHLAAMLQRGVLKLLKTQCQVQEIHPWSYHAAGMLIPLLGFCCDLLGSLPKISEGSSGTVAADDLILIQAITFTKGVLDCKPYKGKDMTGRALGDSEEDAPAKQLAHEVGQALAGFWSQDRLTSLCVNLVGGLFILRGKDMEEWRSSPEEYYHNCICAGGTERLNLCAENLYLTLLEAHRTQLSPVVMNMLQQASTACPAGGDLDSLPGPKLLGVPTAVLHKEAVYNALAVGAYELHDYVDWTSWMRSTLLPELGVMSPANKPIRLRIVRLISAWVPRVESEDRPALYRALGCLLADTRDVSLQLAAVEAMHTLIDDWNFTEAQFSEFVGPVIQSLLSMLSSCTELDSQTQVFNLVNVLIERMNENILPHAQPIIRQLPQLWTDADGQPLVRIQVLLALQRLVNVLGTNSVGCYPLLIPLIMHSIDLSKEDSISLAEDGLCLWLVALRNAPHTLGSGTAPSPAEGATPSLPADATLASLGPLSPDVQQLVSQPFPLLLQLMASSTEHIRIGMQLLSSLAMLGGGSFVQSYSKEINALFTTYLGSVNEKGMLLVFSALEMMISAAPQHAVQALKPAFMKLLTLLVGGEESPLVVANMMLVFARLLLASPSEFISIFFASSLQGVQPPASGTPPPATNPVEALLHYFLGVWMENFDGVSQPRSRKLAALSQCALLTLPTAIPYAFFDAIMANITGVWHEQDNRGTLDAHEGPDTSWGADDPDYPTLGADLASEDAGPETERRQLMRQGDPVSRVQIKMALQESLEKGSAVHAESFPRAWSSLDATIASQIKIVLGM